MPYTMPERHDRVRNLTTGDVGTVSGFTNSGRVIVTLEGETGMYTLKWERWNVAIIKRANPSKSS